MTATGFLLDNVSNTGLSVRQALSALAPRGVSGRSLGAVGGVRWGERSWASISGMTLTMNPTAGLIDVASSGANGLMLWAITAAESFTIPAPDATYSRNDVLSVQVDDPTTGDGTSAPAVRLVYTSGSPSASPVDPATPARALGLVRVTTPKSGGGSPTSTWIAPMTPASGGAYWFPDTTSRDAVLTSVPSGTLCVTGNGSTTILWIRGAGVWSQLWAPDSSTSGAYTAASGWSISNFTMAKSGRTAQMACTATYTGSSSSSGAAGDIVNQLVLTLTDSAYTPLMRAPISTINGIMAAFMLNTDNTVSLVSTVPNYTLSSGPAIWIGGSWITAS